MKNFTYIIALLLLTALFTGCMQITKASLNTEEMTLKTKEINTEENASAVLTKGKQKKDTASLKENSLFYFEAGDGGFMHNVFLYAEDEQKVSGEGEKGVTVFTGHYRIYLGEKDSAVAYEQDVLEDMGMLTFNSSFDQAYPLKMGNKTLIAISQKEDSIHSRIHLFAIKDGGLKKVQPQQEIVTVSGTKIKAIYQKYLQSAHYEEDAGLVFSTWAFDEQSFKAPLHDKSDFGNFEKEDQMPLEHYWMNIWSEKEENYFPFLNLDLSGDVIEKAKQGIPIGSPYPIGTNINEIKKTNPHFIEEGSKNKKSYVKYPEITYFFDEESGNVTGISIPGQRMKTTMDEVIRFFGTPVKEEEVRVAEMTAVYSADKYIIKVAADKNGNVICFYLQKKDHAENPA